MGQHNYCTRKRCQQQSRQLQHHHRQQPADERRTTKAIIIIILMKLGLPRRLRRLRRPPGTAPANKINTGQPGVMPAQVSQV
jgi:hypothetical protein